MAKKHDNERTRQLRRLRHRRFGRYEFTGLDAVVAQISDSVPIPPAVQARIDHGGPSRWYPIQEGGYAIRWPHDVDALAPGEDFTFELGGWDHEHCDVCNRLIAIGGIFWQTERGSCYWICPYCYRRMRQLG